MILLTGQCSNKRGMRALSLSYCSTAKPWVRERGAKNARLRPSELPLLQHLFRCGRCGAARLGKWQP
jgi:hypothetical protein